MSVSTSRNKKSWDGDFKHELEIWEQCESQIGTTKTTTLTKTTKRRVKSKSNVIPSSLNLWSSPDGKDFGPLGSASLSTLGLHQMTGYEELEKLEQGPVQWADDEKTQGKEKEPISTIAFPNSFAMPDDEGQENATRSNRIDHARHNSMPIRQRPSTSGVQQRHPRHSAISARPLPSNPSIIDKKNSSSESSASSSPEVNLLSFDQMSLRQRSMRSLQGIASSWVPGAVRSHYDSESEVNPGMQLSKAKERNEKKPVRLDRRRLEKAVSLAVEAAQASDLDEKTWKERKKRQARRQVDLELKEGGNKAGGRSSRFASLPWKSPPPINNKRLPTPTNDGDSREGALVTFGQRHREDDDDDDVDDDDDSSQDTKKAAGCFQEDDSDDSERSEEEAEVDGYSVDLYISSLGYLLTALNPRDVDSVGDKHREEMKRKLEEALKNLETGEEILKTSSDREEVIQLRVEKELALLEQANYQRQSQSQSPISNRAHRAAQASSYERGRRQSIAGYLASSALDLGLSVGAGALATASRGIASLLPILSTETSRAARQGDVTSSLSIQEVTNVSIHKDKEGAIVTTNSNNNNHFDGQNTQPLITNSQWELTRTLAYSVASTMYTNLASVAEQRRRDSNGKNQEMTVYDSAVSTTTKQDDASDQLLIMAATFARNVKRSPLPSQVRALSSQIISLMGALDERYSFSKRSADVALRKTGQALYYVRKNDLHVKALRMVWAVVEASVAAIEAYRDEEEWKGEMLVPAKIESRPIVH